MVTLKVLKRRKMADILALRETAQAIVQQAKNLLVTTGNIQPIGFLVKGGEVQIMPLSFQGQSAKDLSLDLLCQLALTFNVDFVAVICESWYVERELDALQSEFSPAQCEDRKQAITFSAKANDGTVVIVQQPFHRDNNDIIFEKQVVVDGFSVAAPMFGDLFSGSSH